MPAVTSLAMAPTVSSIGTLSSTRWMKIEIDHVGAEPLEAGVAGFRHVGRIALGAGRAVGHADIAEFGRQHVFVAAAGDGAADQFLIGAVRIGIRGVDEIDAEFGRALDGGDRLVGIRIAVDRRHAHAAKSDG